MKHGHAFQATTELPGRCRRRVIEPSVSLGSGVQDLGSELDSVLRLIAIPLWINEATAAFFSEPSDTVVGTEIVYEPRIGSLVKKIP